MSKVITRKRYIIVRNGTHIMCGLARQYYFKPIKVKDDLYSGGTDSGEQWEQLTLNI